MECEVDGKSLSVNHNLKLEMYCLGGGSAIGIPWVGVKYRDIKRKTSGGGGFLDSN